MQETYYINRETGKEEKIKFCEDLIENTKKGMETKVKLGTPLGYKP